MSYRLTPQAQREWEAALEYQAETRGERAAYEMATVFRGVFKRIGELSPPGSSREQYATQRYRWVQIGRYPYFAVWAPGADGSDHVVVRILHARRDLEALMRETEDWS